MRNYNVYISGMEKALKEKLFFVDMLDLSNYSTIIDFGCGAGDVLKQLEPVAQMLNISLIGIDHDSYMRNISSEKVQSAYITDTLTKEMIDDETLIIFNSVLHEVGDYAASLLDILKGTGATVVVRDMRFNKSLSDNTQFWYLEPRITTKDTANLIRYASPKHLAEFIEKNGLDLKQMYHFLLKYSYVDNWDLELEEDYFSFNYQDLFDLGETIFEENYVLNYKKERVKQDFNIDLIYPTHTKIILKLFKKEK